MQQQCFFFFIRYVWLSADLPVTYSYNGIQAHPRGWPPWPSCHSHTSPAPRGCRLESQPPPRLLRTKHARRPPHESLNPKQSTELPDVWIYQQVILHEHIFNKRIPWFMTLPNTLIPRGVVEQFQRRFLNWCWHWGRQWHALAVRWGVQLIMLW